jgi:hypothetical protein
MRDACGLAPSYRRLVLAYRAGADVRFLRYNDLFDAQRLSQLEAQVAPRCAATSPSRSSTAPHPT